MFTLDANIFVREFDPHALHHAECHTLLERIGQTAHPIVVPRIILPEVAGALSRTFHDPIRARVFVEMLQDLPNLTLISINESLARAAAEVAADYTLRGMDSVYVATARAAGSILVTLDDELRRRAQTILTIHTPAEALSAFPPS